MGFIDRSELLPVLQGLNPWWSGRLGQSPEFRRLAFTACSASLNDTSLRRAVLLSGPRRVGKTTVLQQLADDRIRSGQPSGSVLYLSLDHPLLKLVSLRDILSLYHESVYPEGKSVLLLLDEVQYSRDWETEIKLLVDHRPHYRILATGSASVEHRERLAESGVGRWLTVPMPTLSFFEFVHIRSEEYPAIPKDLRLTDLAGMTQTQLVDLAGRMRPLQLPFQRYLLVGGFPETARQDNISLSQRLLREDVVERVLKRDMTALFGVRNVNDLEKLFIYLCLHSGGILSHSACARALETSVQTVASYLALLERANLIYRLGPAALGGKKVLKARSKYYLVDAALRNAILLKGEEILNNPDEMGLIVETTALRHLFAYHYLDTPEILYWRESATGKEVDIVVRSPAYTFPFEIKYRESTELEETGGLATFCRTEDLPNAYLVTKRERDIGVTRFKGLRTRFVRVPAHMFCYLLGQAERLLWRR